MGKSGRTPKRASRRRRAVAPELEAAVRAVAKLRVDDDCFRDGVSLGRAYLTTCEGLESIFNPATSSLPISFKDLLQDYDSLAQCISADVRYLYERCRTGDGFEFPGDPYALTGVRQKHPIQTVESVAFTISTFQHAIQLSNTGLLSLPIGHDDLRAAIAAAVTVLLDCFVRDKKHGYGYWPATPADDESSVYFTWSVSETVVDLLGDPDGSGLEQAELDALAECSLLVRQWVESSLLPGLAKGDFLVASFLADYKATRTGADPPPTQLDDLLDVEKCTHNELIDRRDNIIYESFYALILLSLLWSEQREPMTRFLRLLLPQLSTILDHTPEGSYPIPGASDALEDLSIVPLALRGVAKVVTENRRSPDFKNALAVVSFDAVIQLCKNALKKKTLPSGLWGYDGKTFEIYYTERAIEALVNFEEAEDGTTSERPKWLKTAEAPAKLAELKAGLRDIPG